MFEGNELIKRTKELVEIPSWEDETEASEYVAELVDGEIDEVGNVFATKGSGEKEIAFVSHLDTVPPSGDLEVYSENNRIFGRGSADMKGPLVAMALAYNKANPNHKLTFASFVGEETDAEGAKHAVKEGFSPEYAVIGEGTANYTEKDKIDVCIAHRGRKEFEIITRGVSSHASQPDLGENAIREMMKVIEKINETEPPSEEILGEKIKSSACVTQINSKGARNVVPDNCEIVVDVRTTPNTIYELDFGDEKRTTSDVPGMKTEDEELIENAEKKIREVTEYSPNRIIKPQATDAGFLAKNGSETIIIGPGEPTEPHSKKESISIDLLEDAYRIYLNIANEFS